MIRLRVLIATARLPWDRSWARPSCGRGAKKGEVTPGFGAQGLGWTGGEPGADAVQASKTTCKWS